MSTVSTSRPPQQPPDEPDPFRYGWRHVRVTRPDGSEEFDQVPLTLEDVLFPEMGDFIANSHAHGNDLGYLKGVLKARLTTDPTAIVLSKCGVDWNLPGLRLLCPDVAVFFGVKRHRPWRTLDVAAEGVRPALVVEVTSPDTRKNDVEDKFDYYYRARVPLYVIADALQDDNLGRHLKLIAYCRTRARYRAIAPDARGWIWLEPVRLWLGVTRDQRTGFDRVACYDENGEELGDYTAISQALAAEKDARIRAEARAAAAEARIRELEAALKRRNGQGRGRGQSP